MTRGHIELANELAKKYDCSIKRQGVGGFYVTTKTIWSEAFASCSCGYEHELPGAVILTAFTSVCRIFGLKSHFPQPLTFAQMELLVDDSPDNFVDRLLSVLLGQSDVDWRPSEMLPEDYY